MSCTRVIIDETFWDIFFPLGIFLMTKWHLHKNWFFQLKSLLSISNSKIMENPLSEICIEIPYRLFSSCHPFVDSSLCSLTGYQSILLHSIRYSLVVLGAFLLMFIPLQLRINWTTVYTLHRQQSITSTALALIFCSSSAPNFSSFSQQQ